MGVFDCLTVCVPGCLLLGCVYVFVALLCACLLVCLACVGLDWLGWV